MKKFLYLVFVASMYITLSIIVYTSYKLFIIMFNNTGLGSLGYLLDILTVAAIFGLISFVTYIMYLFKEQSPQ